MTSRSLQDIVKSVEALYLKKDLPVLNPGDTIKVMVEIVEGSKKRLQGYEGVIIKFSGAGLNRTMTVRRVFQGVGVERVFMLHSPSLDSIKVLRRGAVRRAKLYYMRERSGKAARIREKISTKAVAAEKATEKKAAAKAAKTSEALEVVTETP
jgi:large subunit ribosomal protein L19